MEAEPMTRLRKNLLITVIFIMLIVAGAFIHRTVAYHSASRAELVPPCEQGPDGTREIRVRATFTNVFAGPLERPAWCSDPGLRGGEAMGAGTGTIGDFTFANRWCITKGVLT
jgi:hypothetical protein